MNLIQLLTDQRAYEGITHSRWGTSWNWRWRRVGDDEDRRSPSPEPQTDSRSGLLVKNRRWRRLRLVKRDNSFSLVFFLRKYDFIASGLESAGPPGGDNPPGCAWRGGAPWWVVPTQVPPFCGSWLQKFSFII
jgi:hypothetical protein